MKKALLSFILFAPLLLSAQIDIKVNIPGDTSLSYLGFFNQTPLYTIRDNSLFKPSYFSIMTYDVFMWPLEAAQTTTANPLNILYADNNGSIKRANKDSLKINWANITGAPTMPSAQVNSDWNSGSGVSQILNKPDLSIYALRGDTIGAPPPATPTLMTTNAANNAIGQLNSSVNGKVDKTTTLNIDGTTQDLSTNRTFTITKNLSLVKNSNNVQVNISGGTGVGFNVSDGDSSTTNEIELPSQTGNNGRILSTNGTTPSWIVPATAPGLNNATSYSAGTAYNLTTTPAKLDFGTTDPSITITTPGTYSIRSNVRIDYSGLTNLAANTVTVKLRRTNNTAADLTNATGDFIVPPVTLLTATGGDCDVAEVIYTTSNSNDIIELWGSRSGSISVGNIQAGSAWIVAVRLY